MISLAESTCDEELCFCATGQIHRTARLTHSHLSAHQIRHYRAREKASIRLFSIREMQCMCSWTDGLLGQMLLKISGWDEEKISRINGESVVPSTACTQRYAQNFSGPDTHTHTPHIDTHARTHTHHTQTRTHTTHTQQWFDQFPTLSMNSNNVVYISKHDY